MNMDDLKLSDGHVLNTKPTRSKQDAGPVASPLLGRTTNGTTRPPDPITITATSSGNHGNSGSFRPMGNTRHLKNLFGLATAFMLTCTAYGSLQNLQSSLNYDSGLGLASLSVLYGSLMFSCLIAPIIIRALGTKWTVVVCLACYMVYTAANFYPEFYTLIPAAVVLGLGAGPLWVAQGTYLTTLAISLADVVNDVPETIINRFNGIFFLFFQATQIFGNVISSVIFTTRNATRENLNQTDLWKCGINGTGKEGMNYEDPGDKKTNTLVAIYLVLGFIGTMVAILFMDTIRSNYRRIPNTKYLTNHLLEVIRLMLTPYISLLIPLMIYSGFEQAYISGDFTKSFVSCTIGISQVGYVMLVYGVTDAISSFLIGRLEVYIGRKIIFTAGCVVNIFMIVWMLLWRGQEGRHQAYQFYLMACGWGFSDAVWQTQISSILGVLMPQSQEATFANYRFWQAFGYVVSFGVSNSILVLYKLIALLAFLIVSMAMYYTLECVIRKESTQVRDRVLKCVGAGITAPRKH